MKDLDILARIRGGFDDRGNSLFHGPNNNFVFWAKLDENEYLEVVFNPSNYPSFKMQTVDFTEEQMAEHINTNLVGYEFNKCDIAGVRYSDVGPYCEVEDESEEHELTE